MSLDKVRTIITNITRNIYLATCIVLLFYAIFFVRITSPMLFSEEGLSGFYIFLCSVLLGFFVVCVFRVINQVKERSIKHITIILFVAWAALFLILICFFRVIPITDSYITIDYAKYLSDTGMKYLQEDNPYFDYFSKYGNNYFIVFVFKVLFDLLKKTRLQNYYTVFAIANGLVLYISGVIMWGTVKKGLGERVALRFLFLNILNPVNYFLLFWFYSLTLSMPLLAGILYCGVTIITSESKYSKWFSAIIMGVLTALSFYIRPTSIIASIACCIIGCTLTEDQKGRRIKKCLLLFLLFLGNLSIGIPIRGLIKQHYKMTEKYNYPMTHWIMMGSHGNGTYDREDEMFTGSFPTYDEKRNATLEQVKKNYTEAGISGSISLWIKKMGITFSDGRAREHIRFSQDTQFSKLYPFFAEGKTELIQIYAQSYRIITFLFLIYGSILNIKKRDTNLFVVLLMLTVIGGVIFYCIWEAKQEYSAPFIPVMLAIIACGNVPGELGTLKRYTQKSRARKIIIGFFLWTLISLISYNIFCKNNLKWNEYSVRTYSPEMVRNIELDDGACPNIIEQSFYASEPFDAISFYLNNKTEDSTNETPLLRIEIFDLKKNNLIVERNIYEIDNNADELEVKFNLITPEIKNTKYKVLIYNNSMSDLPFYFRHRITLAVDNYKGECKIDGEVQQYDLACSIYRSVEGQYMTGVKFILVDFCLAVLLLSCFFSMHKWKSDSNQIEESEVI